MIKSLELAGPSCLTHAADDEPIFVLRANDELAAHAVRHWAQLYTSTKTTQNGGVTREQEAKAVEALGLADQMEAWRKAHNIA